MLKVIERMGLEGLHRTMVGMHKEGWVGMKWLGGWQLVRGQFGGRRRVPRSSRHCPGAFSRHTCTCPTCRAWHRTWKRGRTRRCTARCLR